MTEESPEGRPESPPEPGVLAPYEPEQAWARGRERVIALVLDSLGAVESKRAYRKALDDFLAWLPPRLFIKAAVNEYRSVLASQGLSPSTINLRLAAIRKLAGEAADNGLLEPSRAATIAKVKGVPRLGVRLGRWATAEQAAALLAAPDVAMLRGRRDRAVLAVLVGCALRRSELVALQVSDLQQREGRAVFADIEGKGRRVRTVTVPAWVDVDLRSWLDAAGISTGRIFRAINKADRVSEGLSATAVLGIVGFHARTAGLVLAPHDLRRTCAKLCRAAKGDLEQIQFLLGHASIQTTERYLGGRQELRVAVNDALGIPVRG